MLPALQTGTKIKKSRPPLREDSPLTKDDYTTGEAASQMLREPMTRRRIEQYSKLRSEIVMLEGQILSAQLFGDDYVSDVVQNSQRTQVIKGYGSRAIPRLCERKAKYEAECDAVEHFIESLDDSVMRHLLTRRYIEARSLKETADLVGYSQVQAGRLIKDFFEKMIANDM